MKRQHIDSECQSNSEDTNVTRITRRSKIRKETNHDDTEYVKEKQNKSKPSYEPSKKEVVSRKSKKSKSDQSEMLIEAELESQALNGSSQPSIGLGRLTAAFYDVPCEELAKALLGKVLVRHLDDGTLIRGRIIETECYPGGDDKASCSYNGKITEKTKPVFMKPGTMFVYLTYGMYHCFNISSQGAGAAVLLRAVEPLEGLDYMQQQRGAQRKGGKKTDSASEKQCILKLHELCNGPAKLCICFNISRDCNVRDLCVWDGMWVESDDGSEKVKPHHIVTSTRIGIDSVGVQWASKPLRFYLLGYKSVSRVDKVRERDLEGVCSMVY